jgi:hypothetical protein
MTVPEYNRLSESTDDWCRRICTLTDFSNFYFEIDEWNYSNGGISETEFTFTGSFEQHVYYESNNTIGGIFIYFI